MAINNTIKLTGNTGEEVKIIENNDKTFAVFSLATTDSYKENESGEWKNKETIWHDVIVFNPKLIEQLKAFKKGTRLEVTGSLSYRDFKVQDEGKVITKKEAKVIAQKIEQAPLVKKTQNAA